jgi:TusA-related sulfurtransferase
VPRLLVPVVALLVLAGRCETGRRRCNPACTGERQRLRDQQSGRYQLSAGVCRTVRLRQPSRSDGAPRAERVLPGLGRGLFRLVGHLHRPRRRREERCGEVHARDAAGDHDRRPMRRWRRDGRCTGDIRAWSGSSSREPPLDSSIQVRCSGKGCPFKQKRTGRQVTGLFRTAKLRPGAVIEVVIDSPGLIGRVFRYSVRASRTPRTAQLGWPPAAARPTPC